MRYSFIMMSYNTILKNKQQQKIKQKMKSKILWSIAFLLQAYKLLKLHQTRKYYIKLLSQISSLQTLSVKELKNKIIEGVIKIGDLILCKGILSSFTGNTNKSILNKNVNVVYSELVLQKVFQIGESRNTVRRKLGRVFAGVLRFVSGGEEVKVFQTMNTQFLPYKYFKKTVSYKENIFNIGWLLSLFLKAPTRVVSNIYTQSLIPQNSQLVILSRLSTLTPQLNNPLTIAPSLASIKEFYNEQIDNITFLKYCLIFCLILTTFFFYKLCLKPFYQNLLSKEKGSIMDKIEKIFVKQLTCSICQSSLSNVIMNPCGHLAVCAGCWQKRAAAGECVECAGKFRDSVVVFPC